MVGWGSDVFACVIKGISVDLLSDVKMVTRVRLVQLLSRVKKIELYKCESVSLIYRGTASSLFLSGPTIKHLRYNE